MENNTARILLNAIKQHALYVDSDDHKASSVQGLLIQITDRIVNRCGRENQACVDRLRTQIAHAIAENETLGKTRKEIKKIIYNMIENS